MRFTEQLINSFFPPPPPAFKLIFLFQRMLQSRTKISGGDANELEVENMRISEEEVSTDENTENADVADYNINVIDNDDSSEEVSQQSITVENEVGGECASQLRELPRTGMESECVWEGVVLVGYHGSY